ncbi:hypothetical protein HDU97_001732 [Phlyctochytrium planicorne]|nr:hypothetical protein HDU97_001732 [Phlyctochytrium planicorne]
MGMILKSNLYGFFSYIRQPSQNSDGSRESRAELMKKLAQAERDAKVGGNRSEIEAPLAASSSKSRHDDGAEDDDEDDDEELPVPKFNPADADDEVEDDDKNDDDNEDDDDDDDDDDDEEEDTAELLRELAKIKKERAEEKERQERERQEMEEKAREEAIMTGNPLLNKGPESQALTTRNFSVKRRWDDDVVFKNQAKGQDEKVKKRFINDLLRSDFHRKFMTKYVR